MTFKDVLTTLNLILLDSKLSVEAELMLDEEEDILYRLVFTINEEALVLFSFQLYLNKKLLAEKVNALKSKVHPPVETMDIQKFVERMNIRLLPYLKEYNKEFTDYDKLAELYHDTRGVIIGNKFGF